MAFLCNKFGLEIHPSIFLLATLILCSITSLATGTSWGTAGTAGIAMMGGGTTDMSQVQSVMTSLQEHFHIRSRDT